MKEINMHRGYKVLVDDADYDDLMQFNWYPAIIPPRYVYAVRHVKNKGVQKRIYLHRYLIGAQKGQLVDHKNGNTLDCRRSNLRIATPSQNTRNRKPFGKSKYMGVCLNKNGRKKWSARIVINNNQIQLGYFLTEVEAAQAYNDATIKYGVSEYAHINLIDNL